MPRSEFNYDDEPDWRPLEAILPAEECAPFMYMGWQEIDGKRIHHYKHSLSRRYLLVSERLEIFRCLAGDLYVRVPREQALREFTEDLASLRSDGMLAYHETDDREAP